jgi:hypothetical protein
VYSKLKLPMKTFQSHQIMTHLWSELIWLQRIGELGSTKNALCWMEPEIATSKLSTIVCLNCSKILCFSNNLTPSATIQTINQILLVCRHQYRKVQLLRFTQNKFCRLDYRQGRFQNTKGALKSTINSKYKKSSMEVL